MIASAKSSVSDRVRAYLNSPAYERRQLEMVRRYGSSYKSVSPAGLEAALRRFEELIERDRRQSDIGRLMRRLLETNRLDGFRLRSVWKLALFLALLLPAQRADAQDLFAGGLLMAAEAIEDGVAVNVAISNNDTHCDFSRELVEADAERTLRRDGITPRTVSHTVLNIGIVFLSILSQGCVAHVGTDLVIVINPESEMIVLAASAGRIIVNTAPDHVDNIRDAVEDHVSVIANAIRRAEEELPDP